MNKNFNLPFFGYGAGGASSIREVAHLFHVLGFERICAIFDGDKKKDSDSFNSEFSNIGYRSWVIPADDIRDKEKHETAEVKGLLNSDRKTLKNEYKTFLSNLFDEIHEFLSSSILN